MKAIYDKATFNPIFDVQIFESDASGKIIGNTPRGTTSDFDGKFSFTPNSEHVTLRHVSYKPLTLTKQQYTQTQNFQLSPTASNLPTVTITAKKKTNTLKTVAGAGLLGLIVYLIINQ